MRSRTPTRRVALVALVGAILSACGGGGGGDDPAPAPPAPPAPPAATTYAIGGTVTGLEAVGLVLQNNGWPDLPISSNGSFAFPAQLASGASYAVTIKTQPSVGPVQLCTLANGSGTVANSAVANVAITCVSRVFKFLYTTSTLINELRGFSINAADGRITALTWPPIVTPPTPALPIPDPTGRFLYLVTRGSFVDSPKIAVYAADNATGALTEIAASPYELGFPPPAPGALVLPPSIHRSGAFGYVPVLTPTSMLYGATIDTATGELTAMPGPPIDLGANMSGLAFDSTGGFMFAATNTAMANGEIRSFLVSSPSGVLTPIGSFPTLGNTPVGVFLAPGEDYLLTPNINSGNLMVFAVNKTAGTLTPVIAPLPTGPAGSRPLGLSYNRRNNVIYIAHVPSGPTSVAAFRFDLATGAVTPVGAPVSSNGAGAGLLLHPSGRFLFQYNSSTASIQRFALDPVTGAPTLVADVTALPGATQISMIPDLSGRFLYVTNSAAATVSSYSIDAVTGALTLINSVPTSPGALSMLPFQVQ